MGNLCQHEIARKHLAEQRAKNAKNSGTKRPVVVYANEEVVVAELNTLLQEIDTERKRPERDADTETARSSVRFTNAHQDMQYNNERQNAYDSLRDQIDKYISVVVTTSETARDCASAQVEFRCRFERLKTKYPSVSPKPAQPVLPIAETEEDLGDS
jgi:hypothetical protein